MVVTVRPLPTVLRKQVLEEEPWCRGENLHEPASRVFACVPASGPMRIAI